MSNNIGITFVIILLIATVNESATVKVLYHFSAPQLNKIQFPKTDDTFPFTCTQHRRTEEEIIHHIYIILCLRLCCPAGGVGSTDRLLY